MTGTPSKTPQTDAQWALKVEQRLRALEATGPTRIGSWVVSEKDGQLIATKPGQTQVLTTLDTSATATPVQGRVQRIITLVSGTGTFTLVYRGVQTAAINANFALGSDIKNALVAALMPQFTGIDFDCQGVAGGPWTVTLPGADIDIGTVVTGFGSTPILTVSPLNPAA